jgi:hypothetical protein
VYDGIIIATQSKHPHLSQYQAEIPGPKPSEWWEITMQCWRSLHARNPDMVGFPPAVSKFQTRDEVAFREAPVAGRMPSPDRKWLDFYQKITPDELATMHSFLNYVIWYGDAVKLELVSVVRWCLQSRHSGLDTTFCKVWGYHETFQLGHWYENCLVFRYSFYTNQRTCQVLLCSTVD